MTALETLQAGEEPSLLFVEQAVKKHDGGPNVLLVLVHPLAQVPAGRQLFLPSLS